MRRVLEACSLALDALVEETSKRDTTDEEAGGACLAQLWMILVCSLYYHTAVIIDIRCGLVMAALQRTGVPTSCAWPTAENHRSRSSLHRHLTVNILGHCAWQTCPASGNEQCWAACRRREAWPAGDVAAGTTAGLQVRMPHMAQALGQVHGGATGHSSSLPDETDHRVPSHCYAAPMPGMCCPQ